jgi:hypothetical protein
MSYAALDRLVKQVTSQVRWRRAEHYALRAAFYGLLLSLAPLAAKAVLGRWALPLAGGVTVLAAVVGLGYGLSRRVAPLDAARLADREFGLADRLTTALEHGHRAESPMVSALVSDAVERVEGLPARQIVRRVVPREVRVLPLPVAVALVLVLAPPVPVPSARFFQHMSQAPDAEQVADRPDAAVLEERARPFPRDPLRPPSFEERDFAQRSGTGSGATAGDLSAIFKDTSLASQRPDFNSFLKKGDERLKLLEKVDRLPDLQSDFTASQYKMVFRKSKELRSGLSPGQVSPKKLRELLDEMEKLGRKGGGSWSQDAAEGMDALEQGQQDRALEAMEKALGKMRAMEERDRSGKNLKGGRDGDRSGRGRERGRGDGMSPDEQDPGEGEGLLPGKGTSPSRKGEATQRLRASPFDAAVDGESRRGRKNSYDTNMTGRGGKMDSRLQYLGLIGQYQKMMEDTITREQIPRDYHTQIKDYFQSLEER